MAITDVTVQTLSITHQAADKTKMNSPMPKHIYGVSVDGTTLIPTQGHQHILFQNIHWILNIIWWTRVRNECSKHCKF